MGPGVAVPRVDGAAEVAVALAAAAAFVAWDAGAAAALGGLRAREHVEPAVGPCCSVPLKN